MSWQLAPLAPSVAGQTSEGLNTELLSHTVRPGGGGALSPEDDQLEVLVAEVGHRLLHGVVEPLPVVRVGRHLHRPEALLDGDQGVVLPGAGQRDVGGQGESSLQRQACLLVMSWCGSQAQPAHRSCS